MEITEELNQEKDPKGYYTRAKRRKLSGKYRDQEECSDASSTTTNINSSSCFFNNQFSEIGKRKNPIMFLPTEILQNIFGYFSYHDLSTRVRCVNRRFKVITEDLLNLGFKKITNKLNKLKSGIEMSLESTASDAEILCNLKLESMIEILHSQHAIIMSTIWRFVYNDFYKVPKLSMYGGLIIDSYESFFLQILTCAMNLYENRAASTTEDGLPVEVTRIIQMTKNFCIHFDKICEETIRNSYLLNGSKIVDILNCAEFAKIIVNYERISSDNFYAKYSYYFKHSWFIAMPIPKIKDADLCHKIRMMHMRLRRIVLAHNYMFQQQKEYLTEVIVCPSITIKRPGNNVYTGYGDIENRFFYYGVMNDGAYISKFHTDNMNVEYDEHYDEQVINDNEEFNRNPNNIILYNENNELFDEERDFMAHDDNSVNSDVLETLPYLGFKVDVTIRCPIAFAPWKYLNSLTCDEKYRIQRESRSKSGTKIHMDFKCIGARFVRLPQNYQYDEIQRKN